MQHPGTIKVSSCPRVKHELSRKNHKRRPVYKQVSISAEERALRSLKYRMARITRKWENGYVNPDWAESERISRRLASKITLAANAFYLTFGFIFFFFINLQAPQIYAGPVLPHLKSGTENLITIDGHVTHMIQGQPSNYHPPTDVLFYYPGETEPFDQTQTDPNGDYTSTMNYVTVSENNELVKGMKVLGNPYTDKAKLEIGIQEAGKYSINVYDASTGKLLLSQDSELPESNTNISLSGLGSAGVKIVSVTNGEDIYTAKLVQVYSNQFSPDIAINSTPIERNNLKSLEFLTDSLVIRFVTSNSYPEYYTLEKTVEAVTSTVDATMQQMPVTYDFLAYGYNINEGESVGNNASLKVT